MLLFKNCEINNPDYEGKKEVIVTGNQIIAIKDKIGLSVEITDCNKAEVIGESQVPVFRNKKNSGNISGIKLGTRNLRIDIYLRGEKFSIIYRLIEFLLPSALADGFYKLQLNKALATFNHLNFPRQFQ